MSLGAVGRQLARLQAVLYCWVFALSRVSARRLENVWIQAKAQHLVGSFPLPSLGLGQSVSALAQKGHIGGRLRDRPICNTFVRACDCQKSWLHH